MTFLGVPIRFCLFPCVSFCLLYTGYDDDSRDCWKRVLETFETRFPPTKELSNLSSNLSSNPGDLPEFLRYFLVSPIWKNTVDWLLQGASLEHPAVLKRKRLGRGQSRAVVKDMAGVHWSKEHMKNGAWEDYMVHKHYHLYGDGYIYHHSMIFLILVIMSQHGFCVGFRGTCIPCIWLWVCLKMGETPKWPSRNGDVSRGETSWPVFRLPHLKHS